MAPNLMIPGPVSVADDVLHEMAQQVRPHYGADWTAVYNETRELLKQVFRTEGEVHILVGSGSAGLDAAIGSLTVAGETAIVGTNGYFGERLIEGYCSEFEARNAAGRAAGAHPAAGIR